MQLRARSWDCGDSFDSIKYKADLTSTAIYASLSFTVASASQLIEFCCMSNPAPSVPFHHALSIIAILQASSEMSTSVSTTTLYPENWPMAEKQWLASFEALIAGSIPAQNGDHLSPQDKDVTAKVSEWHETVLLPAINVQASYAELLTS